MYPLSTLYIIMISNRYVTCYDYYYFSHRHLLLDAVKVWNSFYSMLEFILILLLFLFIIIIIVVVNMIVTFILLEVVL